jgi:molybdopterin-guanine dinucleotide biosynthesis protein A
MSSQGPIIGVLLAGGDKCLSALAGKKLLTHAIERLRPQVETLLLNANGDARRFASFGLIADYASARIEEFAGPLSGVLAAMEGASPGGQRPVTAPPTRRSFRSIWCRG